MAEHAGRPADGAGPEADSVGRGAGGVGRPAGNEGLRRLNTALVLRSLRQLGPATRAELAVRTGLAKATVGAIVPALEAAGAVTVEESVPGRRGRPGHPVALSGETVVALGLEVNVDYVAGVVLDLAGVVRRVETVPVLPGAAGGPTPQLALLDLAASMLADLPAERHTLVGLGVAVPGLVRGDGRTIAWTPNLDLEGDGLAVDLEALVAGRCPVRVSNDANCAALAEGSHGAATGAAHALYLTGTVGIGAGIVSGGDLVRGVSGFAGEVGHMPVGDSDALCGCGRRGCWEALVGLHAMLAATGVAERATPLLSAAAVAERAADDHDVRRALAALGHDVGLGLAMLAGLLDPEVIVLGGYFVPLGEHVLEPARQTLDARLPSPAQRRPELRLSALEIEAAAMGAAEQVLAAVFSGEVGLGLASSVE